MPSKSLKQAKFMAGIAHGMKPRSGDGPSVTVAKEFNKADAKTGILRGKKRSRSKKR